MCNCYKSQVSESTRLHNLENSVRHLGRRVKELEKSLSVLTSSVTLTTSKMKKMVENEEWERQ
jgi:protein-arginine kinase activator protein McsA